jgi:undecaprenyl-diphosphatase
MSRAAILVLFAVLALAVGWGKGLEAYDTAAFRFINSISLGAPVDQLMMLLSNEWIFVITGGLIVVDRLATGKLWRQTLINAAVILLLVGAADGSSNLFKKLVHRPRPCQVLTDVRTPAPCSASGSFPSNHAANAFAVAVLLVAVDRKRKWLWLGCGAIISYSRIYLGVHYPLDVVTGALIGLMLGCAAGAGMRRSLGGWSQESTP